MASIPSIQEVRDFVYELYQNCDTELSPAERREQQKYATMVQRPGDKHFLSAMLDETSQIRDRRKLAKRIKVLIRRHGIPAFFSPFDRLLFKIYLLLGTYFDFIAIPIIKRRLRKDTAAVIIPGERPALTHHLENRYRQKTGQNVNLLGEVVLGDKEADHRYRHYLEALEAPDINYISIKISGIYAQTHGLNYQESFPELLARITSLYQKAIDFPYVDEQGQKHPKFINLDMEEYKDARFTLRLFIEALSKPEFKHYQAGLVVQAYLPDAWDFQTELLDFAKRRLQEGGAPITMRLVKGANLEMEKVISSLRGWPNPILGSKVEVDANYLKLLDRALEPENARAVHLGLASHNLYTIAYAALLARKMNTSQYLVFEMLEGMANHLWRVQLKLGNRVVLYTPVVKEEHFLNAVSYLVRRLDENTGPDNFLSYSFDLKPGSAAWKFLEQQFEQAYEAKNSIGTKAHRQQDRRKPYTAIELATAAESTAAITTIATKTRAATAAETATATATTTTTTATTTEQFINEPDTDFDLRANQLWAKDLAARWKKPADHEPEFIPLQIGDKSIVKDQRHKYHDRSQAEAPLVYEMCQANAGQVREVLAVAEADPQAWRKTSLEDRHKILHAAADRLAALRGELIGCMAAVTGKCFTEADVEVSEAVDYARYYSISMKTFTGLESLEIAPKGTVLVISPWNFPCAIPVGGIVAALAGGNTCILKPATAAAPVAWLLARAFWDAGLPKSALQVLITDREALGVLTKAPEVKHIILTGGTDTARLIARGNPATPLSAETGGKNAIILTAAGDRDHAIKSVVRSAFGNAGQKCSACSLLLVEQSVYDDPAFKEKLCDATLSMKTGSVWNLGNMVGPMITNQNEKLLKALKLDEGEEWLVPPRFLDKEQYMMAPAVKWNVAPGSYTFTTELFAPLLAVTPIKNLREGIRLVNESDYGLTSGLQSLDENEQTLWKAQLKAGNLYINRGITGAIVNRQPFGGMKLSAFGGGLKAGGPNYCSSFVKISDKPGTIASYKDSYKKAYEQEFSRPRELSNLYGEQNIFRYLPLESMALRLFPQDSMEQVEMIVFAAGLCGTPLTLSLDPEDQKASKLLLIGLKPKKESLKAFIESLGAYERIRTCSPDLPLDLYQAAALADKYIACSPPVREGRVELLHYIREQSLSYEYHRYGSISKIPPLS